MTSKPIKLQRPDLNLEAVLALVGILLGFLFIVIIYILENPLEFLSTWGVPLLLFLTTCYSLGLSLIGFIISFEITFHVTNKAIALKPENFPSEKIDELRENTKKALRRSVQMLLLFIFCFGLFLINLAGFTVAKLFYPFFHVIETSLILQGGDTLLLLMRALVMFVVQLILIIPFAKFQGNLWDSYKAIDEFQKRKEKGQN